MAKNPAEALNLRPRITIHREAFPEVHSYLEAIPPDRMSAVISGLVVRAVIGLTSGQALRTIPLDDGNASTSSASQRHSDHQLGRLHESGAVSRESVISTPPALGIFGSVGSDAFDYSKDQGI